MLTFLLFFAELFILYLLSKKIQRRITSLFWGVTKKKNLAIYLSAILFFPGTFFHEISHFLSGLFLLVPVGDLKLIPEIREDDVKLGSVGIGKTDPVRRFLIGIAPFVFGTLAILLLIHFVILGEWLGNIWVLLLTGYMTFEIGNTMFASRKDLEGAVGLLIFIVVVYILIILSGVDVNFSFLNGIFSSTYIRNILERATLFMLFPILIDAVIIFLITVLRKL